MSYPRVTVGEEDLGRRSVDAAGRVTYELDVEQVIALVRCALSTRGMRGQVLAALKKDLGATR